MIFDCFTYNGEKDMLDIHINTLDPYVDYFVICESVQTFSGKPKPIYYKENNPKVIHIISPKTYEVDAFQRAGHQKDYIRTALTKCDPEDIIIYGDVDEVINPNVISEEGKCRQLAYSYYLNNRSSEDWQGTNVFKYKNIRDLNAIRADHSVILENGGWHFTNVMLRDELIRKIESYDHQEVNIPWVKDGLDARMEANIDFLGRTHDWKGNEFKMWVDEKDLPQYLLDNKEKYKHLWK